MQVLVTPMRLRGVALKPKERRRYPAIRGNLMVNSTNCHELRRAANVARVDVGMPLDTDPLSPLLVATLVGMAVTGFVLSGIEYIDGCATRNHGGADWSSLHPAHPLSLLSDSR